MIFVRIAGTHVFDPSFVWEVDKRIRAMSEEQVKAAWAEWQSDMFRGLLSEEVRRDTQHAVKGAWELLCETEVSVDTACMHGQYVAAVDAEHAPDPQIVQALCLCDVAGILFTPEDALRCIRLGLVEMIHAIGLDAVQDSLTLASLVADDTVGKRMPELWEQYGQKDAQDPLNPATDVLRIWCGVFPFGTQTGPG